jgi:exopolyphosphatase / guanosine-5'-triphosphate,3'-diphosphate pyrophosphatase
MLLAAIDIGSNAVRLYFSNVFGRNGQVVVEKASLMRIPIRLGEDVFSISRISEEKLQLLLKTMQAFKLLIEVYRPVSWKAFATSAMREAVNQEEVISLIEKETGVLIEVIDGLKEASVVSSFGDIRLPVNRKYIMYVDVGGGSTDISLLHGKELVSSNSFKIGTVRLLKDKVQKKEWVFMRNWLKSLKKFHDNTLLVGSGGNINKINKIYGKQPENLLTFDRLEHAIADLATYSLDERIQQLGMRPDWNRNAWRF